MADGKGRASEWNHLADCYAMLAKQSERKEQGDQAPPGDREGNAQLKNKIGRRESLGSLLRARFLQSSPV
jgi:hypothetical protein